MSTDNGTTLATVDPGEIMEVKSANELGLAGYHKMIRLPCVDCGAMRWTVKARPAQRCVSCSNKRLRLGVPRPEQSKRQRGENNPYWRGGVSIGGNGYRYVLLEDSDPLRVMANKGGRCMEHRLVMARHLGRPLESWEQVHHINGNRTDNRIENLELWKRSQPAGIRQADYHCPGCRCSTQTSEVVLGY